MPVVFYLKGLLIGFLIAAPIGPVSILCIEKTLEEGRFAGFITGIGSTLGDILFSSLAVFGFTAIADEWLGGWWVRSVGSVFLLFIGVRMFITPHTMNLRPVFLRKEMPRNFLSAFFINVTNPLPVLAYMAVFTILGLGADKIGYVSSLLVVSGVLTGSALWWFTLSWLMNVFRQHMHNKGLKLVNRITGIITILFGLGILYSVFI